jgi:hypothetical protein
LKVARDKDNGGLERPPGLQSLPDKGRSRTRQGARRLGALTSALWRLIRPLLAGTLQVLLALIIVFEEWGWRPLAEVLGRLARWRPWARLEYAIARLPPYVALIAFALPTLLLLPLKFLALFLIARGQLMLASGLFIAAKVVATALIARLFELTQPALMQIGWFASAHDTVMPWKEALTERVRSSWPWRLGRLWKERLRRLLAVEWRRLSPHLGLAGGALWAATALLGRRLRAGGGRLFERIKRRLALLT